MCNGITANLGIEFRIWNKLRDENNRRWGIKKDRNEKVKYYIRKVIRRLGRLKSNTIKRKVNGKLWIDNYSCRI